MVEQLDISVVERQRCAIEFCGNGCAHRDRWNNIRTSAYNPDLAPCDFWAFPTMKRELRGKKFRSDQRSTAHFREVGGAL
jgi:hypothetical protein